MSLTYIVRISKNQELCEAMDAIFQHRADLNMKEQVIQSVTKECVECIVKEETLTVIVAFDAQIAACVLCLSESD